jgi:hypothetical protein
MARGGNKDSGTDGEVGGWCDVMGLARCVVWGGGKGIVRSSVNVKACVFRRYERRHRVMRWKR